MRFFTSKLASKTPEQLDLMSEAGHIVHQALTAAHRAALPGVSTRDLDEIAETTIRSMNAIPSFKGYEGFPGSICSSVNDVVVHGIPTDDTVLANGDVVTIDCGATLNGWHGDSAITFIVGENGTVADQQLITATSDALQAGIEAMVVGNRLTDISHAIERSVTTSAEKLGIVLSIIEGFGGHGIGRAMHEKPFLPNEGAPGKGPLITEGSVLAIEPMVSLGSAETSEDVDGWTIRTSDGSRSAQIEHTVAATADGPRILTL